MIKLTDFKLWCLFFLYTCIICIVVQFILLPYIFPAWQATCGLLKNTDSVAFHEIAVDLVNKIRTQGWSAWQLRPQRQAPAGIASILYFFICPDPKLFIIINAALHASAALLLVKLLNLFVTGKTKAIFCVLPFLIFPSNLQWTAQLHKNGFSILGELLILYSLINLVSSISLFVSGKLKVKEWYLAFFHFVIYFVGGGFLIWIVRPFSLIMIKYFSEMGFYLFLLVLLIRAFKKTISFEKIVPAFASILLILFVLFQIKNDIYQFEIKDSSLEIPLAVDKTKVKPSEAALSSVAGVTAIVDNPMIKKKAPLAVNKTKVKPSEAALSSVAGVKQKVKKHIIENIKADQSGLIQGCPIEDFWEKTPGLPMFMENKIYSLAQYRKGFRFTDLKAKSNIDQNIGFNSAKSLFVYLPRAAQIGFLAPFPNMWFTRGSTLANTFLRKIMVFEMMVTYFALIFLLYALWYWRRRIEIWIISVYCIYMLLIYSLVVTNVGTLYRMKYFYMTTLVALGIVGFITFLEQSKILRKNR